MRQFHYSNVTMSVMASHITGVSAVCLGADERNSALLAFVRRIPRWPVESPHKELVTRKIFPLDDVIMRWYIDSILVLHIFLALATTDFGANIPVSSVPDWAKRLGHFKRGTDRYSCIHKDAGIFISRHPWLLHCGWGSHVIANFIVSEKLYWKKWLGESH